MQSCVHGLTVDGAARQVVIDVLDTDTEWCSSALSMGEAMALVARLTDEEAARRDRARYCHATQTGPRWARELGAAMARGEA